MKIIKKEAKIIIKTIIWKNSKGWEGNLDKLIVMLMGDSYSDKIEIFMKRFKNESDRNDKTYDFISRT